MRASTKIATVIKFAPRSLAGLIHKIPFTTALKFGAGPEPPFEPNSGGWDKGVYLCWIARHCQNIGMHVQSSPAPYVFCCRPLPEGPIIVQPLTAIQNLILCYTLSTLNMWAIKPADFALVMESAVIKTAAYME